MAFNTGGAAADCFATSSIDLNCCDVYGNVGGDYVGGIAGQNGVDGNFSADPLLCGDANPGDPYTLVANSPCAEGSNPGCGQVGARGAGCAVEWQGGGPHLYLQLEGDGNYGEPPTDSVFTAYVCVTNLEPGEGLTGVALALDRSFDGFLLSYDPVPSDWLAVLPDAS